MGGGNILDYSRNFDVRKGTVNHLSWKIIYV